jgi:hypothetical protein
LLCALGWSSRIEGSIEHDGDIARWIAVTHQRLCRFQLVARRLADRGLQREPFRCERLHERDRLDVRRNWRRRQLIRAQRFLRRNNRGDRIRHIRPRREACDEHLDLELALVRGLGDQLVHVVVAQVWSQQDHGGEMQPPVGDGFEDLRERPPGPCGADPCERGVCRQVQHARAIRVHRRARRGFEQLARIDLRDVRDQYGRRLPVRSDQRGEVGEQLLISDVRERVRVHETFLSRQKPTSQIAFRATWTTLKSRIDPAPSISPLIASCARWRTISRRLSSSLSASRGKSSSTIFSSRRDHTQFLDGDLAAPRIASNVSSRATHGREQRIATNITSPRAHELLA